MSGARSLARAEFTRLLCGEPIRVRGKGQWERNPEGQWKVQSLTIDGWESLEDSDILGTINALRGIKGLGWKQVEDVDDELRKIREGE